MNDPVERATFSVSLVRQGKFRFFTLTIPIAVLSRCCSVDTRDDDPQQGFQRRLDSRRAKDIADYIDSGNGTIPTSIILSAQEGARLEYTRSKRSISFDVTPRSFLILDGQHRVYGFAMARTELRVPVVIYNNLSRTQECRLFIDINTKQRPVPAALLLDIQKLAEQEDDVEGFFREIFDRFNQDPTSPLQGKMSPASSKGGRISRVTFNAALKSIHSVLADVDAERGYSILSSYLTACLNGLRSIDCQDRISNPTVFRALVMLFPDVVERASARHGNTYLPSHFEEFLSPLFVKSRATTFRKPPTGHTKLHSVLEKLLKQQFKVS